MLFSSKIREKGVFFKLGYEHGIRFGRDWWWFFSGGGNVVSASSSGTVLKKGKAFFNLFILGIFVCFLLIILKSMSPDVCILLYFAFLHDDSMVWKRFPN